MMSSVVDKRFAAREMLDYEYETVTQSVMEQNPGMPRMIAGLRALVLILRQERSRDKLSLLPGDTRG